MSLNDIVESVIGLYCENCNRYFLNNFGECPDCGEKGLLGEEDKDEDNGNKS